MNNVSNINNNRRIHTRQQHYSPLTKLVGSTGAVVVGAVAASRASDDHSYGATSSSVLRRFDSLTHCSVTIHAPAAQPAVIVPIKPTFIGGKRETKNHYHKDI